MLPAKIRSLVRALFGRRGVETRMSEELQFHIDARSKDLMSRGVAAGDADRQARMEFGSVEKYKEEVRQARGLRLFDELTGDVRYAVRTLAASPGFALTAVLTLALGIGLNTAIFSVVEALLLRPLPVAEPDRIVSIYTSDFSSTQYGASSFPDYQAFRERSSTVTAISAYRTRQLSLNAGAETELVSAEVVVGNYFSTLGVSAARGRLLTESDDVGEAPAVAVISYGLWARRFSNDPGIVGREVEFNGRPFTIVGVADGRYAGATRPFSVDAWISLAAGQLIQPGLSDSMSRRDSRGWFLIARLAQDATPAKAQAEFDVLATQLYAAYPEEWRNIQNSGRKVSIVSETGNRVPPDMRGPISGFMAVLMILVGVVLLTACANLANLLLARGTVRGREIGVRLALGCGHARLIRQLLTENVLLSLVGGAAGTMFALWIMRVLISFRPPTPRPIFVDLELNLTVLAFAFLISLLAGLLFGLAPALHAVRRDVVPVLKEGTARNPARRFGLRTIFVTAQIACSTLLLIGAGLFMRSLQNASAIEIGFNPANIAVTSLNPAVVGYDEARGRSLYDDVLERVTTLPGVQSTSLAMAVPLNLFSSRRGTFVEGYQPRPGEDMETALNIVSPQYFETMQIPIVRGRSFTEADRPGAPPVIIVNEAFAERYWPGIDPLGKRVGNGPDGPFREVIGVTRTGKYNTLAEEPLPYLYLPLRQQYNAALTLHVKTAGDPASMLPSIRDAIRRVDRTVPIFDPRTMDEQMGLPLLPARAAGTVLGAFGLLALLLASVGIYGVMAYSIAQRTREIGVRVALGAVRRDVLRLILGHAVRLIATGLLIGVSAAVALARFVAFLLYGITPSDPIAFTGAIVILIITGLVACYLPASRAMRIDPVRALRSE
jgi:predicted permease